MFIPDKVPTHLRAKVAQLIAPVDTFAKLHQVQDKESKKLIPFDPLLGDLWRNLRPVRLWHWIPMQAAPIHLVYWCAVRLVICHVQAQHAYYACKVDYGVQAVLAFHLTMPQSVVLFLRQGYKF